VNAKLEALIDAAFATIWIKLDLNLISYEDPDTMQSHFAGKVRYHCCAVLCLNTKQRVGQRFHNSSYNAVIPFLLIVVI